jgi:D-tyrosyl-tRNA(Tyr) deacylase
MDQVTIVDNHYMTREFLESQLVENKNRIAQLEEHIQKVTQRSYADSADRNRMVESMQEWTLAALSRAQLMKQKQKKLLKSWALS